MKLMTVLIIYFLIVGGLFSLVRADVIGTDNDKWISDVLADTDYQVRDKIRNVYVVSNRDLYEVCWEIDAVGCVVMYHDDNNVLDHADIYIGCCKLMSFAKEHTLLHEIGHVNDSFYNRPITEFSAEAYAARRGLSHNSGIFARTVTFIYHSVVMMFS